MRIKPLLLAAGIVLAAVVAVRAQDFPAKSDRLVNDYTKTLSADEVDRLERKLVAFDDSASTQIAVVLIHSSGSYDIAQYGTELGQRWGVGRNKKDNGILLLAALDDHHVTIQTGYGVEGALPDAIASRIIRNDVVPAFKDQRFFEGLDAATNSIIAYTKGEYKNEDAPKQQRKSSGFPSGLLVPIIIIILVVISRIGRGGGGGGRIIGGRGGASPFWWFLAGSAMGRGNSGWGGSGGSGWSGGSGGGGFGGFGGGSFGGGGASGSW